MSRFVPGPRTAVNLGLLLGVVSVTVATVKLGYVAGAAVGCIPLVLYAMLFAIKNPYWAYTGLFIANYFIMAIVRYFPSIPGGVIMDALITFNIFTLLIRACY